MNTDKKRKALSEIRRKAAALQRQAIRGGFTQLADECQAIIDSTRNS
jgi:hypothetical protein